MAKVNRRVILLLTFFDLDLSSGVLNMSSDWSCSRDDGTFERNRDHFSKFYTVPPFYNI